MATIKEQTEKTEQLKTTLDDKVIAIADEINKQDDINITRLSEVPNAIAKLKNSRKRWATGSNFTFVQNKVFLSKKGIAINLSNITFKANTVIANMKVKARNANTWITTAMLLKKDNVRVVYREASPGDLGSLGVKGYAEITPALLSEFDDSLQSFLIFSQERQEELAGRIEVTWIAFE